VEHYQSLDAAFDLFLLLNAGKSDPGVFGEDLLDWINRHYISPTSEEGTALADLREPWTDPQFWPVLVK
jgi:nuclear pore complex protein Nup85